jgi:hypothetical protein
MLPQVLPQNHHQLHNPNAQHGHHGSRQQQGSRGNSARSVGGGQYRALRGSGGGRRGEPDAGVVLGHRASSAGSFLGMRGGVPDATQLPRYYPDTAGDEAMLTLMHQLRSELASSRAECSDLAESNHELRARLALLEVGGMPTVPEPEPEPEPARAVRTADAGGNTDEPWPGDALREALQRVADLEAALEARNRAPTPPGTVFAEAGCQTVEPWLGPALAAANERIAALESTVASERETQVKLRETHKVWRDAHVAELEDAQQRVAELEALLEAARREAEEASARDLRIIGGLEGEKNTALLRAKEAEDELARLTKAQVRAQKQQAVAQSIESVKIGIIAPKVSITFSGGGGVSAAPGMPRDELQRVLETEVLPKFVRILTDDTPNAPAGQLELVDPANSSIPPGQNKWLQEHITLMRGAIEAQLGSVFAA